MSSEIYVGVTPTLYDIQTESEKIKLFVNSIFVHNTGIQHNTNLKRILAASVLRFHDEFLGIIRNEPSGKYKYPIHHPFQQKIICVLSETKVSDQTFKKHKKELIYGLKAKILLGVGIDETGSGSSNRYVDSCCVVSVIDEQGDSIVETHP